MTQVYISMELPNDDDDLKLRVGVYATPSQPGKPDNKQVYALTVACEKTSYGADQRIVISGTQAQITRIASAINDYLDRTVDQDGDNAVNEAAMVAAIDRASDRVRAASHAFARVTEKWSAYQATKRERDSGDTEDGDDNESTEVGTAAGDLAFDAARERGKV